MDDQKQSFGDVFRAASQKARDALPAKIRETVLLKCGEAAEAGKNECDVDKEIDIKHLDYSEQEEILKTVCELLRKDGLEAQPRWGSGRWCGIWVSWAVKNPKEPQSKTNALFH